MRRWLVVVAFLLVGCVEGETAVPTATMAAERPSSTATHTPNLPTATSTVVPTATVTPAPTNTLTPTPYPSTTPLPPLVWAENMSPVALIDEIANSVVWSPVRNEFVATTCDYTGGQAQLFALSAPDFAKREITPDNFTCPPAFQSLMWTPDAKQILFSSAFPEDHSNHPSNYGYDNSAIWITDRHGAESYPVNFDAAYGRYLRFTDWLDEQTLVYVYYCGGGYQCIVKLDLGAGERLNTTFVHVGSGFQAGADYVAANNGMGRDFNTTAVAIVNEKVHEDSGFAEATSMLCLSGKCGALTCVQSPCIQENSRFEDWLPQTNTMLVVTWPADDYLTIHEIGEDDRINRDTPTKLQLWDIDAETITELVANGIFGRFSHNGGYLAYHTLSPQPRLHVRDLSTGEEIVSLPSAEPTLDVRTGKQFLWSPSEANLIYRDNQENWRFLAVKDGRSTPITLSGGARLSAPQWSFDGRYLSMRVAGPEWGTAVLRTP